MGLMSHLGDVTMAEPAGFTSGASAPPQTSTNTVSAGLVGTWVQFGLCGHQLADLRQVTLPF